jgi:hypothetical protein
VPAIFYRIIAIASVERRHDLRMSLRCVAAVVRIVMLLSCTLAV